jgi:hypothetical protein
MSSVNLKKSLEMMPVDGAELPFLPFMPLENLVHVNINSNSNVSSLSESTKALQHHIHILTALLKTNVLVFIK